MAHSFARPVQFPCSRCGKELTLQCWLIVDTSERPDLLQALRDGTMNIAHCPNCRGQTTPDLPLLIYRPGAREPFLFCARKNRTSEENSKDLGALLTVLRHDFGGPWNPKWDTQPVRPVDRDSLAADLAGGPDGSVGLPEDIQQAVARVHQAEQEYARTGEQLALAGLSSALNRIVAHRGFASLPSEFQCMALFDAGRILLTLSRVSQNPGDLEQAVALLQRSAECAPPASSMRFEALDHLAISLLDEYRRHSRSPDLERAIECLREATQTGSTADSDLALSLDHLATALCYHYVRTHEPSDLDEAIACCQRGLALAEPPPRARAGLLNGLGLGLMRRHEHFGSHADLDRAIDGFEQSRRILPTSSVTGNLGLGLLHRFRLSHNPADLERAIDYFNEAVQTTPETSSEVPGALSNLGIALRARYTHRGGWASDLEEAISCFRKAIRLTTTRTPHLADFHHNLAQALSDLHSRNRDPDVLEEAIANSEQALELAGPASPDVAEYLQTLGYSLFASYRLTLNTAELLKAIDSLRRAAHLLPPQSSAIAERDLAVVLTEAYHRTGELECLLEAAGTLHRVVAAAPPGSPDYVWLLVDLAAALSELSDRTGKESDIEQAIDYFQQALTLASSVPTITDQERALSPLDALPDLKADILNGLGNSLFRRYDRTGDLTDLDQAVSRIEEALEFVPPGTGGRESLLSNLGSCLRARYLRTKNMADLERSLHFLERAVDLTPAGSDDLAARAANVGIGLQERYDRLGDSADLDRAIQRLVQAVELTPPGSPDRPRFLIGLGAVLRKRHEISPAQNDIDRATACFVEAEELSPAASPDIARAMNGVALCSRDRYAQSGDPSDLSRGIEYFQKTCDLAPDVNVKLALLSSLDWGRWAMKRASWQEAVSAFGCGMQAADRLYSSQILRAGRELWLRDAQKLPANAAYALARTGDLEKAVLALELGRTRVLADAMERERTYLTRLPALGYSDLYARYRAETARIAALERHELFPGRAPVKLDLTGELRAARAGLNAAVDAIRHVPGYADFFRAPVFGQIRSVLTKPLSDHAGPVAAAYVAVTAAGGLALIVGAGTLEAVWLDFDESDLHELLLTASSPKTAGGYLMSQLGAGAMQTVLTAILPQIGGSIVGPLAFALHNLFARSGQPGLPTLILIPTGLLSLLPLHAAPYDNAGKTETLLDAFNVVYTPSARVLSRARDASGPPTGAHRLVAVANPLPLPEGVPPLKYAEPEVEEISRLFADSPDVLYGPQATLEAVKGRLTGASYVHFACHGVFDAATPLSSRLLLSGRDRLTLTDLIAGMPLQARLVVLSACQTAITDFQHLPEESVGLPSGLLQGGAAAVIGTLWPVNDLSTALLMIRFYGYYVLGDPNEGSGCTHPSVALRRAQLWLRNATNAELSELFQQYKNAAPDAPGRSRFAYALAREKFAGFTLSRPDACPFGGPYYWAPFAFYGT